MHVYLIQNKANGKVYVGQTVQNLDHYWSYNKRCAMNGKNYKPALYAAIRKYGPENFDIRSIHVATSKEELDNAETAFIKFFGTRKQSLGYNLTDGGDGTVGAERTEAWKRNISLGNMGKTWSYDRKLAASVQRKGKVLTEEHKAAIGAGVQGTKKPQQWVEKLIARNKDRKGTPHRTPRTSEHTAKLVASRLSGRVATEV
jgi:group I intron endonuclease